MNKSIKESEPNKNLNNKSNDIEIKALKDYKNILKELNENSIEENLKEEENEELVDLKFLKIKVNHSFL